MTLVCIELNNEGRGIGCKLMWDMNCFLVFSKPNFFVIGAFIWKNLPQDYCLSLARNSLCCTKSTVETKSS